jgi:hypothetical protein
MQFKGGFGRLFCPRLLCNLGVRQVERPSTEDCSSRMIDWRPTGRVAAAASSDQGAPDMFDHSRRGLRAAGLLALATAMGPAVNASIAHAAPANVSLDNWTITSKDGAKFFIKHADFTNTTLDKDEIQKLLNPDTSRDDEVALIKKLKVDRISIPAIDMTPEAGGAIHIHEFEADNVESGKVAKVAIASIEGDSKDEKGGNVAIKSGTLRFDNADLAEVLKAAGGSREQGLMARVGHISWEAIDITAPDEDSGSGKNLHVAVGSFDLTSDYDGDVVKHGATTVKGLIIEPSAGSDLANQLATLGYSRLELGAAIGARYEATAKTLALDNLTIEGVAMGSIGVKANFGDVDPLLFTGQQASRLQALTGASIASLEIKIVNAGLFEKALAFYAKQEDTTIDAVKQQFATATTQMAPLLLGGSPDSLKVASEVQKFINEPNSLMISVKAKGEPLKATDFMGVGDPSEIVGKLDISAAANQ